ncbi:MAG: YjfB family protein [Lachnospiraceae bacterium]|jgi:hypothetical protein|nr:YjfB family protein [Lachnospiraceae bacterium]
MDITSIPDIPALSTAISSAQVSEAFSTEMLAKQISMVDENMAALTKMMELSVNPSVGGNFDMSV